ncbi:hypothetical protein K432DRAFT_281547, partial [Lepidopterella palustris CBS 459.81]
LTPEQQLALKQREQYDSVTRTVSIACLIACPVIAVLPPRKFDFYTVSLGGIWLFSANHVTKQYSGRSIWQNMKQYADFSPGLPTERARDMQKIMEASRVGKKARDMREEQEEREKGVLEKVWMGEEKEGWKERRLRKEQEALEEGRGYGSLIMEQIWDVWNWGKKEGE